MSYHDQLKAYEIKNFITQFGYKAILQEMFEELYFVQNDPKMVALRIKIKEALDCANEDNR